MIVALAAVLSGCVVIGQLTFAPPGPETGSGRFQVSALLLDPASGIYPHLPF